MCYFNLQMSEQWLLVTQDEGWHAKKYANKVGMIITKVKVMYEVSSLHLVHTRVKV